MNSCFLLHSSPDGWAGRSSPQKASSPTNRLQSSLLWRLSPSIKPPTTFPVPQQHSRGLHLTREAQPAWRRWPLHRSGLPKRTVSSRLLWSGLYISVSLLRRALCHYLRVAKGTPRPCLYCMPHCCRRGPRSDLSFQQKFQWPMNFWWKCSYKMQNLKRLTEGT